MKRYGPDSLSSWVVVLACCFINIMMYGMAKLSGVLFVASISRFNVGRTKASFPYTFCYFVRNFLGPLVGYLGHKFGFRLITVIGAIFGTLGTGLCYFAESIQMVTFLWGVLFGIGLGFGSVLLPVSVNQHFNKNKAIANGIALSGGSLGSLTLPSVVEILLNNYGLSKTFLFLGGFMLSCLPPALLLRKPHLEEQKTSDSKKSETQSILSGKRVKLYTVEEVSTNPPIIYNENPLFPFKLPRTLPSEEICNLNENGYREKIKSETYQNYSYKQDLSESDNVNYRPDNLCEIKGSKSTSSKKLVSRAINLSRSYHSYFGNIKNLPKYSKKSHSLSEYERNTEWSDTNYVSRPKYVFDKKGSVEINSSSSLGLFSVIFDSMFVIVAITNSIFLFTSVCMYTIIVDFARDLQVGESNEKYVLMTIAGGDLTGRFFLGFVTDRGYMSTTAFCTLCFACQGLFIAATVWSDGLTTLLIFAALYGLSEGGIIIIFPVIISQYINPEKQTVAISSKSFLNAPLCLAVAPLIGYSRDEVGAYDWLFYGLAILSATSTFAWMFTPCIAKCREPKSTNN